MCIVHTVLKCAYATACKCLLLYLHRSYADWAPEVLGAGTLCHFCVSTHLTNLFQTRKFRRFGFLGCVLWLQEVNRKCPAGKTLVQLSTPFTNTRRINSVTMNSIRDRQADRRTEGRTDRRQYDAMSRSYFTVYIYAASKLSQHRATSMELTHQNV